MFIKTRTDIFSYGVSQYYKNSAYAMSFNVSEEEAWKGEYKKIWSEVESQLFEKLMTGLIKREGRYINGKLKTWKERIRTNFHGQDVPCNIHCNATAVLKIDSVYKQGKIHHPQVYIEECKYNDAENQQCSMLRMMMMMMMMMMMDFLRCKKRRPKDFCNLPGVTKLIINEQGITVRT